MENEIAGRGEVLLYSDESSKNHTSTVSKMETVSQNDKRPVKRTENNYLKGGEPT